MIGAFGTRQNNLQRSVSELHRKPELLSVSAAARAIFEIDASRLTGRCPCGPPASRCGFERAASRCCARSGDPDARCTREAAGAGAVVAALPGLAVARVRERDGAATTSRG